MVVVVRLIDGSVGIADDAAAADALDLVAATEGGAAARCAAEVVAVVG